MADIPDEPPLGEEPEPSERRLKWRQDVLTGVTLACVAAALAVCGHGASRTGADELLAANEKAAAFEWYHSKSLRQALVEGEVGMLRALLEAGAIDAGKAPAVRAHVEKLTAQGAKFEREKTEVLLGSSKVGEENWAQDLDGEMGKIVGARQWEAREAAHARAGDAFGLGTLVLQLGLVMGAIAFVVPSLAAKRLFWGGLVVLGLAGTFFTWQAYSLAWLVP